MIPTQPDAAHARTLRQAFDAILQRLLAETGAGRTTLRLDDPRHGFNVDDVAGEALAAGEKSLRGQTSIDQRAAATAEWIDRHRRLLVQDDLADAEPKAPEALLRLYGVKAQMLAPVIRGGRLDGWISVHDTGGARRWRKGDRTAAMGAVGEVLAALARGRERHKSGQGS